MKSNLNSYISDYSSISHPARSCDPAYQADSLENCINGFNPKPSITSKFRAWLQNQYKGAYCVTRTWLITLRGFFGLRYKLSIPTAHPHRRAIKDLMQPGGELFSSTISLLFDKLCAQIPSLYVEYNLLVNILETNRLHSDYVSGSIPSGTSFVIIPLLTSNNSGNHYTMLCIDPLQKTVEYYDSTGDDPDLLPFLESVKNKYFPNDKRARILVNSHRAQWDDHNCGVFIVDYVERRIRGESFETISLRPKSPDEIEALRFQMAQSMLGS